MHYLANGMIANFELLEIIAFVAIVQLFTEKATSQAVKSTIVVLALARQVADVLIRHWTKTELAVVSEDSAVNTILAT